jgi:thiol-disulfide isomerase/thioredoxin
MELVPRTVHAPEISSIWLNSPPLSLQALRGEAVLLDFFDYTCVNCLRTLPYLRNWHEKYTVLGLRVIGIHAPEFYFSRTPGHVAHALGELGIQYPVVMDNDYQIWRAYANKCWPSKYLIDKDGYIRYYQVGEGGYEDFEDAIREVLRLRDPSVRLPERMPLLHPTDDLRTLAACPRPTPETYLGVARGRVANPGSFEEGDLREFQFGNSIPEAGLPELSGWWGVGRECVEAAASNGAESALRLQFSASEVNLVLMPPPHGTAELRVSLNGRGIAVETRGKDLTEDETGGTVLRVSQPRMYELIRSNVFFSGVLEVRSCDTGLQLFAVTFGTCAYNK